MVDADGEETIPIPFHGEATPSKGNRVADWDPSHESESVDWYSEYIARHAVLSCDWLNLSSGEQDSKAPPQEEVTGIGLLKDRSASIPEKVIGTLEDGSVCIWSFESNLARRKLTNSPSRQLACSRPGLLFGNHLHESGSSTPNAKVQAADVTECISVDSGRRRAYIAISDILNELDVETLQIISQKRYAWPISALSQESDYDCPLTVGTPFSLHLHDPREKSGIVQTHATSDAGSKIEESQDIAFLPNYTKLPITGLYTQNILYRASPPAGPQVGPLSILHQNQNSIVLAGRFPSLLFYDRRRFPQLETTLHSGARLAGLTSIDYPPKDFQASSDERIQTLVACGEYNGRGSLELYSVPHTKQDTRSSRSEIPSIHEEYKGSPGNFVYQNRQTASRSKLLSVATHGTRIVFSDADGGLKWVERDGHSLVRRWNINEYNCQPDPAPTGPQLLNRPTYGGRQVEAGIQGGDAVRKMIAIPHAHGENGERGDGDLLIWTGEKVGVVTVHPQPEDEVEAAFEEENIAKFHEREYDEQMRQAFQMQADEFKWIRRFGTRYGGRG